MQRRSRCKQKAGDPHKSRPRHGKTLFENCALTRGHGCPRSCFAAFVFGLDGSRQASLELRRATAQTSCFIPSSSN